MTSRTAALGGSTDPAVTGTSCTADQLNGMCKDDDAGVEAAVGPVGSIGTYGITTCASGMAAGGCTGGAGPAVAAMMAMSCPVACNNGCAACADDDAGVEAAVGPAGSIGTYGITTCAGGAAAGGCTGGAGPAVAAMMATTCPLSCGTNCGAPCADDDAGVEAAVGPAGSIGTYGITTCAAGAGAGGCTGGAGPDVAVMMATTCKVACDDRASFYGCQLPSGPKTVTGAEYCGAAAVAADAALCTQSSCCAFADGACTGGADVCEDTYSCAVADVKLNEMDTIHATFGTQTIYTMKLAGLEFKYADDLDEQTDDCVAPAGDYTGKVAVMRRSPAGGCDFLAKAASAQSKGAVAVVVYDRDDRFEADGETLNLLSGAMVAGGGEDTVGIPVFAVTMAQGEAIIAGINKYGAQATGSFHCAEGGTATALTDHTIAVAPAPAPAPGPSAEEVARLAECAKYPSHEGCTPKASGHQALWPALSLCLVAAALRCM
jgi:hypothetical protein